MPLPGDVTTVTLTGHFEDASGTPLRGTVIFTPSGVIKDTTDTIILEPVGIPVTISATGTFSVVLPATDASVLQPSGWSYTVAESLSYTYGGTVVASRSYIIQLPSADAPTIDLSQITPIGSATTPPSGTIGNVVVSGTPASGQIIIATSATTASWQANGGGGGTPSNTVVSETSYGQTSGAGTATTYSRGDHTHGSPSLTSLAPTTSAVGDSAAVGTATTPARADHTHGREAYGAVTAQTSYGASSSNGTATTNARSDHAHGTPALASTVPTTSAVGDAAAVGTGTTPARSDHTHGRESFGGAPATTEGVGQAAAAGIATTPARSDHVHPMAAAGTPGSSAVGDTASVGTSTNFSAADHRHGRENFGNVTAQTTFGLAAANGSAVSSAHSDHTHGTPSAPTPASIGASVWLAPTGVKTSAYTAAASDLVVADISGGSWTATLPSAPTDKTIIGLKVIATGGANTLTIAASGSDVFNKAAGATSLSLGLLFQGALLQYAAGPAIWYVLADDLPLAQLDGRYVAASSLPVSIPNGGTGQTTASTAFAALSPMTTLGDTLIYGSGGNARLAGSTSGTKQFLTQTGTGSASAAPAWGTIAAGDLPAGTTSTAGALQLDGTASDIQPLGTRAAGSTSKSADAGHVHSSSMTTFQLSTSPISGGVMTSDGSGNGSWAYSATSAGAVQAAKKTGHTVCTIPFEGINLSATLTSGTLFCTQIYVPAGANLTKLGVYVSSAGGTLSGVNGLGVYTEAGVQVALTGDMTSAFGSTGYQEGTLGSAVAPTSDTIYYACILSHATTAMKILAFNLVSSVGNVNGHYPAIVFASQASFPASFTPSSGTANNGVYWFGGR